MAKSYTILYLGISEDKRTFNYALNSDSPKQLIMKVYESFMDYVEYEAELELVPGISYWTLMPSNTKFRYVEFYDKKTYELVGLFGLDGDISYFDYDYNGYIEGIVKSLSYDEKKDVHYILNEIFYQKIYNNDFVCVEKGDLVVDIGFNYGFFSIDSLRHNPSKIIGFEPNPKLVKKFRDANIPNIELHELAVSNINGKATFYDNVKDGMSTIKTDVTQSHIESTFDVSVVSFNDFIKENKIEKIDYLKVDCEGSEYEIFESIDAIYLSNNINKIAIEFHHPLFDNKVIKMIEKIRMCGFDTKSLYRDGDVTGMLYCKKIK